ncbi:hypothetical protein BVY03_04985 [bacterium K02(2017)]|nr:hypothetical protein BVY03_04985 [bacterium K02(2017)]
MKTETKKLSPKQRKKLRGMAHHYDPVVMIGKHGLSESVTQALSDALLSHELIKVKFQNFKDQKKEIALKVETTTKSHLVGLVGNIAIFYKQNPDPKKRKIDY